MLYLKLVKNSGGTMRFIHTGDIHLGATPESKRPWAANRGDEIWNTLERLIKKIKIDPVDLLIIAGDMFHRQPCFVNLRKLIICFRLFLTQRLFCAREIMMPLKKALFMTVSNGVRMLFS